MSQQGIRNSAAAVVRLYQLYREAVTAQPYDPVAHVKAIDEASAAVRARYGQTR